MNTYLYCLFSKNAVFYCLAAPTNDYQNSCRDQTALEVSSFYWLSTESSGCSAYFGANEESMWTLEPLKSASKTQVVNYLTHWLIWAH